jgi:putative flavoprotein involved in K+ transport
VTSLTAADGGFLITTDRGSWRSRTVVLATGACNVAKVPAIAAAVPAGIATISSMDYRNPGQLGDGGVLVVGASATGTQLADEIHRSGRPVTISVGEHVRAPRVYRGKDIEWWMDVTGLHDERYDTIDDIDRARRLPSFQLAGSPERKTLDLNALTAIGVRLVGRIAGIAEGKAQFSGSLHNNCAMADLKMNRLLNTIDEWAAENGRDGEVDAPHRLAPTDVEATPPLLMDLTSGKIRTIVWATGYRPDYSWLKMPVLDRKGQIRHDGGVVDHLGLYLMGMQFLRRRKSALIDGAGDDARELSDHLTSYLRTT